MSRNSERSGGSATRQAAADRLGRLAARHHLSAATQRRLHALLGLVIEDPLAPTSLRDPLAIVDDHLADSLAALELAELRAATSVADLGAGAGFPGLPLAIALPAVQFTLVESNARKCEFIERAIARCEVGNADAVAARAEEWPAGLRRFDVVTARALAPLPVVAEYAAPLLRIGGVLVAWRGRRDPHAEAAAGRAAVELRLRMREPLPVRPYPEAEHRHLHLFDKLEATPGRFPRRPGIARKRPLGG